MIRRLAQQDRDAAIRLLSRNPIQNLYLLSNIEQLGFDSTFCEFWGDFAGREAESLRGLINRYMNGWVIYGEPDASWQELAAVMDSHPTPADRLQDNPGGVASFVPYLRTYEAVHTVAEELMVLTQGDFRPGEALPGHTIRRAIAEDLDALVEFYADAGSMARSRAAVERPLRDLRVWVATRDGAICSAALTNAELATSAMVGGVFTESGSRNRGLGRGSVQRTLCGPPARRQAAGPVLAGAGRRGRIS